MYVTHLFNHLTQSHWTPILSWTQISHLIPVTGDREMNQTGMFPMLLEQTTDDLGDVAKWSASSDSGDSGDGRHSRKLQMLAANENGHNTVRNICFCQNKNSLVKAPTPTPHFLSLSRSAKPHLQSSSWKPMLIHVACAFYCWVSRIWFWWTPLTCVFYCSVIQDWVFISLTAQYPFIVLQLLPDSFLQVDGKFMHEWNSSKLNWKTHIHVDTQDKTLYSVGWLPGAEGSGETLTCLAGGGMVGIRGQEREEPKGCLLELQLGESLARLFGGPGSRDFYRNKKQSLLCFPKSNWKCLLFIFFILL